VNLKDERGWTALMWASFFGYGEAVDIFLSRGADIYVAANNGSTALSLTGLTFNKDGQYQSVASALNRAADKDIALWIDAARKGDLVEAAKMFESGVLEKVRSYFKDKYANVSLVDLPLSHTTALGAAIENDRSEVAKFLIEKGANINALNGDGDTPLIRTSGKGNLAIVKLLIEKGANVNYEGSFHHTALGAAIENDRSEVAKFLIEKGANINALNNSGDTPLIQAASKGNLPLVQLLIEKGADVNHKSNFHHTALTMSTENGHKDVVLFLLSKGATTTVKTNAGKQALDLARAKRHPEIVAILEKYPYDRPVINIKACADRMCEVYLADTTTKKLYEKDRLWADLLGLWIQYKVQYPSLTQALVDCFPEKTDGERAAIGLKVILYLEGDPPTKKLAKNALKKDFINALRESDPSLGEPVQAKVVDLLYELHQKTCQPGK
jgi:ankyrin repeat protein